MKAFENEINEYQHFFEEEKEPEEFFSYRKSRYSNKDVLEIE
jgi:hypothetical protein